MSDPEQMVFVCTKQEEKKAGGAMKKLKLNSMTDGQLVKLAKQKGIKYFKVVDKKKG